MSACGLHAQATMGGQSCVFKSAAVAVLVSATRATWVRVFAGSGVLGTRLGRVRQATSQSDCWLGFPPRVLTSASCLRNHLFLDELTSSPWKVTAPPGRGWPSVLLSLKHQNVPGGAVPAETRVFTAGW